MQQAGKLRQPDSSLGPKQIRGSTLLGIAIGFVLGLGVAAAIAYVLAKTPNPFENKSAKSDVAAPHLSSVDRDSAKQGERPRFDFSKILPGTEERKAPKEDAPTAPQEAGASTPAAAPTGPDADKGRFFLQAGAYQNAADAEDQRAKLALMGIEATMQTVALPDNRKLNRVRLGPYGSAEEMNQVKMELQKQGVTTAVIRNP
jgi:cell division protein FtsN